MKITQLSPVDKRLSGTQPPKEKKSTEGMTLPPDNRHHWDGQKASRIRKVRDLALPLLFRFKDHGFENIPQDANFIAGPTHQGYMDAPVATRVVDNGRPFASMADVNQFRGPLGRMLADIGSFPVDRYGEYAGNFPDPVSHTQEILNEGKNFVMYPEGRFGENGHVYPIKNGIARISLGSNAKYAVPMAQHFEADKQAHPLETIVGGSCSVLAAAAGIYASTQGGLAAGIAGLLTGLVGGAAVGAGIGFLQGPQGETGIKAANAAKYGLIGAAVTGATAAAVGALAPGLAPAVLGSTSVLTGLTGLGLTYHWTHRSIAHTSVGRPIELEPYRQRANNPSDPDAHSKEVKRLTSDFYSSMISLKDELTGQQTPYKMDPQGHTWGKQADGRWALLELQNKRDWVPVQPMVYQS